MNKLGIILKIAERCNLNCTYCYFFNGPDDSYKQRPARIKNETIERLVEFLLEGIQELELNALDIAFHGGEPLLYGIKEFDDLCNILITNLSSKIKLRLTIQTNGLLINEAWIALFKKHSVDVGISIDGPKEYNDKHRVDFFGRGSYDRLLKKIELLHKSSMRFGVLTVVNPDIGGKRFIVLLQMS
ncbi:radical SAM protein [Candidatus Tisiphia endosymbiont of Piscicola geometra]|uniref:radical SAM protein n=1 Tax=Candidatus Tisiphia endosymbiont of Piscicola geometra TaxID=3066273 RepID=UPI00312CB26F